MRHSRAGCVVHFTCQNDSTRRRVSVQRVTSSAHWDGARCTVAQVVTEYEEEELAVVLAACELMDHHLTAAIVSNDVAFQRQVLGQHRQGWGLGRW